MEPNLSEQLVETTKQLESLSIRVNRLSEAHDANAQLLANLAMQVQLHELITARMLKDQASGKLVLTADGNPDTKHYLELMLSFFQSKEAPKPEQPKEHDFVFGGDYGRKV